MPSVGFAGVTVTVGCTGSTLIVEYLPLVKQIIVFLSVSEHGILTVNCWK